MRENGAIRRRGVSRHLNETQITYEDYKRRDAMGQRQKHRDSESSDEIQIYLCIYMVAKETER